MVGETEDVALEQEEGEVRETEEGPFETEGDIEAQPFWDGGIVTAGGLLVPSLVGSEEDRFGARKLPTSSFFVESPKREQSLS